LVRVFYGKVYGLRNINPQSSYARAYPPLKRLWGGMSAKTQTK